MNASTLTSLEIPSEDSHDWSLSITHLLRPCNVTSTMTSLVNETEAHKDFYQASQLLTGLVMYPIFCVVGLCGNSFAIAVVLQRKMTSTSVFLIALALADILKVLNDCLYIVVSFLFLTHDFHGNRMWGWFYPFSHYVFNQSLCVSAWLTVAIGIERYLLVCKPAKAKQICNVRRAKFISLLLAVFMSLLALPCAFRYTRVTIIDPESGKQSYDVTLTKLGCSDGFRTAYIWCLNLTRSVIPLCILAFLNSCIILALHRQSCKAGKQISASKNRITVMLVAVIVVFLVCVTPDAFMSTVFNFGYYDDESYLVKGLREYSDLLLLVNSAVNFLVYCRFNQQFRSLFREVIGQCCAWWHSADVNSGTGARNFPLSDRLTAGDAETVNPSPSRDVITMETFPTFSPMGERRVNSTNGHCNGQSVRSPLLVPASAKQHVRDGVPHQNGAKPATLTIQKVDVQINHCPI